MITLDIASHTTPLGNVRMALHEGVLCALAFEDSQPPLSWMLERRFGRFVAGQPSVGRSRVARALDAYFGGDLCELDALTVDPGGTAFQRAVWSALRAVPAGETVSYGALARSIDRPEAARAVGAACGANPIWLVVPCHRAIGSDGRLVGYAGGLQRKGWLLGHEQTTQGLIAGRVGRFLSPASPARYRLDP
jgi:methylated-DNA-[protein]-cysteine S-methyltransferase